jgi:hypothetical protein
MTRDIILVGKRNPWSDIKAKPNHRIEVVGEPPTARWVPTRIKNGCGDLMTKAMYLDWCESGAITDWDGHGVPVNAESFEAKKNCHAERKGKDLPEGTTHILWFNK